MHTIMCRQPATGAVRTVWARVHARVQERNRNRQNQNNITRRSKGNGMGNKKSGTENG